MILRLNSTVHDSIGFVLPTVSLVLNLKSEGNSQNSPILIMPTALDSSRHDPEILVADLQPSFGKCVGVSCQCFVIGVPKLAGELSDLSNVGKRHADKS